MICMQIVVNNDRSNNDVIVNNDSDANYKKVKIIVKFSVKIGSPLSQRDQEGDSATEEVS